MTREDKINFDLDVLNLVNKLIGNKENKDDVVMFLRGDSEFQTSSVYIKGNVRLMGSVILSNIDNNEEFRKLMLSTVGSWLSKNPEQEKIFMENLEYVKAWNNG